MIAHNVQNTLQSYSEVSHGIKIPFAPASQYQWILWFPQQHSTHFLSLYINFLNPRKSFLFKGWLSKMEGGVQDHRSGCIVLVCTAGVAALNWM